jgi:hypothetical protein
MRRCKGGYPMSELFLGAYSLNSRRPLSFTAFASIGWRNTLRGAMAGSTIRDPTFKYLDMDMGKCSQH